MDERSERGVGKGAQQKPAAKGQAGRRRIGDQALLERIFSLSRRIQALRRPSPESLLSDSEFVVLSALASAGEEFITMKRLSERASMPPSLISRIVKGLEERKGYAERLPGKEDRRQVYIRVTAEGERTLRRYIRRRIGRLRPIVRALGDEEREVVWRSIEIFETILERTQT
jgi:DNA-binding MarR family transcriptional regulator